MLSLWEVLKTSKGLPAPDGFTALFAHSLSDTYTLAEISGIPPLNLGEIVEIVDYTIEGNIYQSENVSPDTPQEVVGVGERTGNLFDKNDCTIVGYINLNGNISEAAHWFTTENYIKCSGTITITALNGLGSGAYITCYDEQKNLLGVCRITDTNHNQSTINLIDGTKYIKTCCRDDNFDSFMLNSGSTPLPYEPYGYKLDVVSRSKNLFDISADNWKKQNTTINIEVNENKVTISGVWFAYVVVPVKQNTAYALQYICESYTIKNRVGIYGVINGVYNNEDAIVTGITPGKSFNSGDRTEIAIMFYASDISGTNGVSIYSNIQLELGTEATSYEPYTPPITTPIYLDSPLYKIGDYANVRGMTEEVRAVKELVLTGEEYWTLQSINGYGIANIYIRVDAKINKALCTHYTERKTLISDTTTEGFLLVPNSNTATSKGYFYIRTIEQSVDDFKAFLAEQYSAGTPVKVYYVLATPETKTVEPVEIPTIQGTNIIDINTEVKPSNLKITYKSKM